MARFIAQILVVPFGILALGGWALGDASRRASGGGVAGNLGSVPLHLTYARDALDVGIAIVLIYVGFVASRHVGKLAMIALGTLLVLLGVAGFVIGDDAAATRSVAGLHFPLPLNLIDLVGGVIAALAGAGTIEDEPKPFLR